MNGGPANSSKTVYYFNRVAHPVYLQTLAGEPDIELHKLVNDSPDGDVAPVMAAAHAYQIDSTRAAIPEKYWASEAQLARNPNLLLVSTNGAGYDTVDVAACTRAGILCVFLWGNTNFLGALTCAEIFSGLLVLVSDFRRRC